MIKDIIKTHLKNKLLEQKVDAEIDEGRNPKYTEDELIDSACKYKTMGEFIKNENKLYQAARNRDILLKIRTKCNYKYVGNLMERMVYMYIWENNVRAVYFGLTCDEDRRYEEHAGELDNVEVSPSCSFGANSAVRDFIKKHGKFDRYVALTDGYINAIVAAGGEMCLIDHFRNDPEWKDKIIVVNKTKGGELGGKCSVAFSRLIKDSDKILSNELKTADEFRKKFPEDFDFWTKDGKKMQTMNRKLGLRFFEDAPYSSQELIDLIKNSNTEEEFQKNYPNAYKSAKRNKFIDIFFPKNQIYKNLNTNQTYTNLKDVAKDLNLDLEDAFNTFKRKQNVSMYNVDLVDINNINEITNLKSLIKQILKEETSPDEIKKGIDIAVKVFKRRYPFVVGWQYSDSPDKWAYKIYIDLELDYNKSMEFYGLKPHPIYGKFITDAIKDREELPYPYSMMNYEEEENFDDLEYRKLQDDLADIYEEMIPNKLKMKQTKAVFNQDDPKDLGVDNYIFVK